MGNVIHPPVTERFASVRRLDCPSASGGRWRGREVLSAPGRASPPPLAGFAASPPPRLTGGAYRLARGAILPSRRLAAAAAAAMALGTWGAGARHDGRHRWCRGRGASSSSKVPPRPGAVQARNLRGGVGDATRHDNGGYALVLRDALFGRCPTDVWLRPQKGACLRRPSARRYRRHPVFHGGDASECGDATTRNVKHNF